MLFKKSNHYQLQLISSHYVKHNGGYRNKMIQIRVFYRNMEDSLFFPPASSPSKRELNELSLLKVTAVSERSWLWLFKNAFDTRNE